MTIKHVAVLLGFNIFLIVVVLAIFEGFWHYCLTHPSTLARLPVPVGVHLHNDYMNYNRNIIQFDPACAIEDERLLYRLRPGRCTFSNVEFSTEVRVNSLGVRDDEESMHAPEVIVLGDSYAMGWGVGQEESFPQRIEWETGKKVLNASVSSYGTAREAMLLERADTSALRYLVVQYSSNDDEENEAFINGKGGTTRQMYESEVKKQESGRYFFGKHLLDIISEVQAHFKRRAVLPRSAGDSSPEHEADLFVNILRGCKKDLSKVKLIVVQLEPWNIKADLFVPALVNRIQDPKLPDFLRRMTVLDVSDILDNSDYFIFDDHLNVKGHEKVAGMIAGELSGAP